MLNRFVYGLSTVCVCVACVCINFSAVNPDVWKIYVVGVGVGGILRDFDCLWGALGVN